MRWITNRPDLIEIEVNLLDVPMSSEDFEPELLEVFATAITGNSLHLKAEHPLIWSAANSVHLGFVGVNESPIVLEEEPPLHLRLRIMLCHMAHTDWIHAFILTCSGQRSMGIMLTRRAIEYVAYAAKISDEEKATLYIEQASDATKRKVFSGRFRIPTSFKSEDYQFLRPLLGAWEEASVWGVHANFETTAFRHVIPGKLGHQDNPGTTIGAALLDIVLGAWLVGAIAVVLRDHRSPSESQESSVKLMADGLELLEQYYPPHSEERIRELALASYQKATGGQKDGTP